MLLTLKFDDDDYDDDDDHGVGRKIWIRPGTVKTMLDLREERNLESHEIEELSEAEEMGTELTPKQQKMLDNGAIMDGGTKIIVRDCAYIKGDGLRGEIAYEVEESIEHISEMIADYENSRLMPSFRNNMQNNTNRTPNPTANPSTNNPQLPPSFKGNQHQVVYNSDGSVLGFVAIGAVAMVAGDGKSDANNNNHDHSVHEHNNHGAHEHNEHGNDDCGSIHDHDGIGGDDNPDNNNTDNGGSNDSGSNNDNSGGGGSDFGGGHSCGMD